MMGSGSGSKAQSRLKLYRERFSWVALGRGLEDQPYYPCAESLYHTAHRHHLFWIKHSFPNGLSLGWSNGPTLPTPCGNTCQACTLPTNQIAVGSLDQLKSLLKGFKEVWEDSEVIKEETELYGSGERVTLFPLPQGHATTSATISVQSPLSTWPNLNLFQPDELC